MAVLRHQCFKTVGLMAAVKSIQPGKIWRSNSQIFSDCYQAQTWVKPKRFVKQKPEAVAAVVVYSSACIFVEMSDWCDVIH